MAFLDENRCEKCGKSEEYAHLDKHHELTQSRGGKKTVYFCRECHIWIHNNPEKAKEKGWYIEGYVIDK